MSQTNLFSGVKRFSDALLGRGEHAVTLPPMDGPIKPNTDLDLAEQLFSVAAPDNLVSFDGTIYFSSKNEVFALDQNAASPLRLEVFDRSVTAMAVLSSGHLLVALEGGRLISLALQSGEQASQLLTETAKLQCITSMLQLDDDTVLLTNGSDAHIPSHWKRDLMSRNSCGSLIALSLSTRKLRVICDGLAYPNGLARLSSSEILVSESWHHRLLRCSIAGGVSTVLADLPGYPSRLAPAKDGGFWLSVFAPRSQLVEFVLREPKYRQRMMAEVPEPYWIAPAYSSGFNFLEPLQQGGVKSMGIMKPWAPTRSYGLVVKLDRNFKPAASLHSRADGRRHGVNSVLETDLGLIVASAGGNELIAVPKASLRG